MTESAGYLMPRIGSLCSGYGGLELGLITAIGGSVAWHVEYDKHPSAVLEARFPGVPNYGDVTTTDWSQVEPVDWLTAGYPCQPFSHAGKRRGSKDERHLWPAVRDAIGVLRPGNVLLENVAGHVSLGLDAVLADLAAMGYDTRWGVVRAADAGAPHRRERVFIVAADTRDERHGRGEDSRSLGRVDREDAGEARERQRSRPEPVDRGPEAAADADLAGRGGVTQLDTPEATWLDGEHRGHAYGRGDGPDWGAYKGAIRRWEALIGRPAPRPTEPATRGGERLSPLFVEWMQGLVDGWVTDVLPRNPALKALGNGVVPQQAALAVSVLHPAVAVAA